MGKKEMGKASTNASICETGWGILFIYWIVLKINQNLNQNVNKGTCRKTCVCLRWTNMPVHVLNNTLLKQFLMKLQNEVLDSDYFIDYNLTWISFAKLCIDIFSLFQFYFKRFRKTDTSLNVNIPEVHGLKSLCTKFDISVIFPINFVNHGQIFGKLLKLFRKKQIFNNGSVNICHKSK